MTKSDRTILAELLDMAADQFGNHGCNDFELENTDDNWALILRAYAPPFGDGRDQDPRPIPPRKLMAEDFVLMSYFARVMEGNQ